MCGIAGAVRRNGGAPDGAVGLAMARALRHRGPDRQSQWRSPSGTALLAHSRLNVIDLNTGDQPMASVDGSVLVVFNGEIYNFRELRTELEGAGHRFRTRSDTEVIVEGYRAWGEDVVSRLDGMFAFALWDESRQRLLLARDRAGKKPLFLHKSPEGISFASEIKALRELPGVDLTLDEARFPEYLAYGYVPSPGTFYRGVEKLPPASYLVWGPDVGDRVVRYWELIFRGRPMSRADAIEEVRELLRGAVERRLVSDVPLGAFLSGGIDSTLIVSLMSQLVSEPVRTFSIGFEDDANYDETGYARTVAEALGTRHTEFRVGAQSVDLLDRLLEVYDEPFGDSSAIPTSIVSGLTREHVTVALTGDGGDELFAGYPRFLGFRIAEGMPGWVAKAGRAAAGLLPHNDDFRSPTRRAERFFETAGLSPEERMLRWIGFHTGPMEALLQPGLAASLDRSALLESFRAPLAAAGEGSALDRVLTLNFHTYLLDDLLVKTDRSSMLHSLELRSPFLDTNLMEFAAQLPDRLRVRRGSLKVLLKAAFPDLLPREIRNRPKWGFGIPLPSWLRGPWRGRVEDLLLDPDSRMFEWIRPDPVGDLVKNHQAGSADHGHALWALMTLEAWLRRI